MLSRVDAGATLPANREIFQTVTEVRVNRGVAGEYRLLEVAAPAEVLVCAPGQFFHLLCPASERDQPFLRRPMSIYGYAADDGRLQFLYKVTGAGTRGLAQLQPGDTLDVVGPLGTGFSIRDEWRSLLLVARGVGLATLAPLAQEARRLNRKLVAICSARSTEVLVSVNLFRDMGAEVITVTDQEGTSDVGNLRRIIQRQIATNGIDALYTCGSNRLLKLLQDIGRTHDIPGEIALEQQMACGIGMCQCCVRPFLRAGAVVQERVCREGPVFDLQEALPW